MSAARRINDPPWPRRRTYVVDRFKLHSRALRRNWQCQIHHQFRRRGALPDARYRWRARFSVVVRAARWADASRRRCDLHELAVAARFVPVLPVAITQNRPIPHLICHDDSTHKVIAFSRSLLQQTPDEIAVVERRIIGACRTIRPSRK